jgi:hypothetical protein
MVLLLLKNRVPDDPSGPKCDTALFEQLMHGSLTSDEVQLLKPAYEDLEAASRHVDVSNWKATILPDDAFMLFPFVKDYFAGGH